MRKKHYHTPEDHAYDVAMRKYPVRWWEIPRSRLLVGALFVYPLLLAQSGLGDDVRISILGVLIVLACFAADTYSTVLIMRLKPEFDRRGMEFRSYEANRFLPIYPTAKELTFNWMSLFTICLLPIVFLVPVAALFAVLIEGAQALSNLQTWARLKLALKIADSGAVDPGVILT